MELFHFQRTANQYVTEYRWNSGILYVVGSFPYADPGFVEASRFNTLAVGNMPYATFPSK
jgi:hypothetical protein